MFKFILGGLLVLCAIFSLASCSDSEVPSASSDDIVFYTPSYTSSFEPTGVPSPTPTVEPTHAPTVEPTASVPSSDDVFVKIIDFVPNAIVELKYATADNFTGQVIYDFDVAYARYGTVKKLAAAAEILEGRGYFLKIWDAYRPVSAQFRLWDVCPNPTYVANPNVGFSNHTRGCAIDLTIVDSNGKDVVMPTGFDDFSVKADRDYSDVSKEAADNALMLQNVMESCGFSGYYGEWWHYNDIVKYEPETSFEP